MSGTRTISESDWKLLRGISQRALHDYCERVLREARDTCDETGRDAHARYLELYRLLQNRDKELANLFNGLRRSTAFLQLAGMLNSGVISQKELACFSAETRECVGLLAGIGRGW